MNLFNEYIRNQFTPAERRQYDNDERFERDVNDVITGAARDFWDLELPPEDQFDCEQWRPIYDAVWRATKLVGATGAERWAIVERAIVEEARKYATLQKEWRS